ncbi:hypothetical protein EOD39_13377 [Acipenser ruthenus]|uniref:Uncharacterized protein n=1 Tax=Acipenser ruthenus TaxID=7906 RepID=A0A662YNI2_ACIRT|nr:hypothetical protein EOD39_13377 [Acipenser ruthenus]
MGCNIRTPLPVSPAQLTPEWPDLKALERRDREMKLKQAIWYNRRHKTQTRPNLIPGQKVWVKNIPKPGIIREPAQTTRSYDIDLPAGSLRRNRSHIRVVPSAPRAIQETPKTTRSGRTIRVPVLMDL